MISISHLREIAKARLEDAEVLFKNQRPDGAWYLCGYAVELTLKAWICITLNWREFPETKSDFQNLTSFKTHKLDMLLKLSGQEEWIRREHLWAWTAVSNWDSETRYQPIGKVDEAEVIFMLIAANHFLEVL